MLKKILKILLYVLLVVYALMMFVGVISSGAVLAIVFLAIISGYVIAMLISIKCAKRLWVYRDKSITDHTYKPEKGDKPLFYALMSNLPFYYIYFVVSLVPMKFPVLWIIAGLPCCAISALKPINKNYQVYNTITASKNKTYWLIQPLLAVALWLIGRAIALYVIL